MIIFTADLSRIKIDWLFLRLFYRLAWGYIFFGYSLESNSFPDYFMYKKINEGLENAAFGDVLFISVANTLSRYCIDKNSEHFLEELGIGIMTSSLRELTSKICPGKNGYSVIADLLTPCFILYYDVFFRINAKIINTELTDLYKLKNLNIDSLLQIFSSTFVKPVFVTVMTNAIFMLANELRKNEPHPIVAKKIWK